MGSSSRSLELKLMNCKALQAFNFFQKISVYALVSLVSDDPSKKQLAQQQRTPTDTEGDKNPEWNHDMRFDLGFGGHDASDEDDYDDHHFLHFDLRAELAVFGDKSLGQVHVLIKDLINKGGSSSSGIVRFLSYEARTSDNKPNGVLSFSYKVLHEHNGGGSKISNLGMSGCSSPEKKNNGHIDGYPIVNHVNHDLLHHHHSINTDVDGQANRPSPAEVHSSSYFPSSYVHSPSLESYYSAEAVAPHQIHYPPLETPYPAPAGGEGYSNYPRFDDRFHYLPPPPPPAVLLPPVLPQLSLPPFPPPPPPPHHHHHHYVAQGPAAYDPSSTWAHDHQPYPRSPDPLELGGGNYAYPYSYSYSYSINYTGDRARR